MTQITITVFAQRSSNNKNKRRQKEKRKKKSLVSSIFIYIGKGLLEDEPCFFGFSLL